MGADSVPGPRSGTDRREGAYQWVALAAEIGIDLTEWRGEYILIQFLPAVSTSRLDFLFVAAVATLIDETTVTGGVPPDLGKIENAPQWINGPGFVHVQVPLADDLQILKIKPTAAARISIRQAQG